MAFNGYLTNAEINDLTAAALQGGLLTVPRQTLLVGIPAAYAAALPAAGNALDQFTLDLVETSRVERMAGGEIPVLTLLQNATQRLRLLDLPEAQVFSRVLGRVTNVAAGVPPLPEPAQLPEVVSQERIIGLDDTVGLGFLAGGLRIAQAVALISVPRFDNGQPTMSRGGPWVAKGTAWLIAPNLAITNHHVINARLDGQGQASPTDLALQAEGSTLRFDFDVEAADGHSVRAERLVASSSSLDYALLQVADADSRPIPVLAPSIVRLDPTSRMAVNIVQHPRGEHKQVAFRNNLVSAADDTAIRYFTDTDHGSSGSPVCDDSWRVVALHRGSRHADVVNFQGKDEAFVNFGSQIRAVLEDIASNDQAASQAIAAAQPQ